MRDLTLGEKRGIARRIGREVERWQRRLVRLTVERGIYRRTMAAEIRPGTLVHGLPGPLVVSLTSFAARFATLPLTLKCLLSQTMPPDAVLLWLAPGDAAVLPEGIRALRRHGLEVRECVDLRSYNKFVHARAALPEAHVVTADDDVHYPPDWLERLVRHAARFPGIVCHRAHLVRTNPAGQPLPYRDWRHGTAAPGPSPMLFPTGVGGVLYRPGSLPPEALNRHLFLDLAPTADDVWLYWMGLLAGQETRRVPGRHRVVEWPGSQTITLRSDNITAAAGNDRQIAAMIRHFGLPYPQPPVQ